MHIAFVEPATAFTDGLQVIHDYHDSMLSHGRELLTYFESRLARDMTPDAAGAALRLHTYYTRANALHHRDEEQALFPMILDRDDMLDAMMERLVADHEEIEQAWLPIAAALCCPEMLRVTAELLHQAHLFERLQRGHLTRENEDFLPRLSDQFSIRQRRELGGKLAAMRGLNGVESDCRGIAV